MMLQIFLISSLFLNSFLLIYLFGLIPFLLFLSILSNSLCGLYIYFLLSERLKLQSEFSSLLLRSENFLDHLKNIYELEMFYGDETLEALLKHSKDFINDFYEYEEQYFTDIERPDVLGEEDEEEKDASGTEHPQTQEKTKE